MATQGHQFMTSLKSELWRVWDVPTQILPCFPKSSPSKLKKILKCFIQTVGSVIFRGSCVVITCCRWLFISFNQSEITRGEIQPIRCQNELNIGKLGNLQSSENSKKTQKIQETEILKFYECFRLSDVWFNLR